MAFFGLLITIVALFSVVMLYYMHGIGDASTALQQQALLYSNIVSVETFARIIDYSMPSGGNASAISNWRASIYSASMADMVNVTFSNSFIEVRSLGAPYAYAVVQES
ncbi:MAG: hypothetical protein M1158_04400 [Candidatus Marsarchaeota archaeon]|jgi:hypothetical protein|nr:hypothetical protein [Candidatus Marsarchaeota archaeon]